MSKRILFPILWPKNLLSMVHFNRKLALEETPPVDLDSRPPPAPALSFEYLDFFCFPCRAATVPGSCKKAHVQAHMQA